MTGTWAQVGLVLVLVLVNAAFAGSEVALISLRPGQLQRLEEEGGRGRLVARLARDPNQFLSTIQIGITLAGFLASAAAAITLAEPLVPLLGFLDGAAELVAVVLVTAVLAYVTLVVGELAPKRIALQRPERWARLAARPLALVTALTRPLVWLLSRSTDVLVPRRDVVALPANASAAEGVRKLVATTHGRAPVFRGDLDDVVGISHLVDLVDARGRVADHVRPALALPESLGVLDGLRRLQAERQTLAIVLNEYGGTEGIVTMGDLLEELVGEIYDEFDQDSSGIRREADGSVALPGAFPMHDLADLGIWLPEGPYATVAGLALQRFGRVPAVGETVEVTGWRLEVLAVERRAITRLRLSPLEAAEPASDEGAPSG